MTPKTKIKFDSTIPCIPLVLAQVSSSFHWMMQIQWILLLVGWVCQTQSTFEFLIFNPGQTFPFHQIFLKLVGYWLADRNQPCNQYLSTILPWYLDCIVIIIMGKICWTVLDNILVKFLGIWTDRIMYSRRILQADFGEQFWLVL